MYPRAKLIAAGAALAVFAAPAAAGAHGKATPQSVKTHVRSAHAALDVVASLVRDHEDAAAAIAFARNRRDTLAAQREARALAARAPRAGVAALKTVAALTDEQGGIYADLVDEASGTLQVSLAKGAAASVKGRDRAVAQLTALAGTLPPAAAQGIARAIAAVLSDGAQEAEDLSTAAAAPQVSTHAQAWLQLASEQSAAGMNTAVGKLRELLPTLPAAAQPHVEQAIDRIAGVMEMVQGILNGIFGDGSGSGSTSPIPSGLPVTPPIPSGIPAGPFASQG